MLPVHLQPESHVPLYVQLRDQLRALVHAGDLRPGDRIPASRELAIMLGVHRTTRSEEHTSELQSLTNLVCRLLLEKKKKKIKHNMPVIHSESIVNVYKPVNRAIDLISSARMASEMEVSTQAVARTSSVWLCAWCT